MPCTPHTVGTIGLRLGDDMTIEMFREYRANPSRKLRDRIFNHHYKLACEIAHQYRICCDEPFEDLLQLASMGLLAAIERFDPSRGSHFSPFACPYIKGEIRHYLRDKGNAIKIPRTLQNLYQRGKSLASSNEQTAISLGCTQEEWREAKAIAVNRIPVNIEQTSNWVERIEQRCECSNTANIKRLLNALSWYDNHTETTDSIEPLPLTGLDDTRRALVEMYFLQHQSLTRIKKSTIASGIKDLKSHLLSAALELCKL